MSRAELGRPSCRPEEHSEHPEAVDDAASEAALLRAAGMFRAAGDVARLRLLRQMLAGELCVTELAQSANAGMSTVSQQLRLLRAQNLVRARREGKHIFYALADRHVRDLVRSVLDHAGEYEQPDESRREGNAMSTCTVHENHTHQHGPDCGHTAVEHDGHTDYLHDGHLHHVHGDHVDEHVLEVNATNPGDCTPNHDCGAHAKDHIHGPGCGHEAVPHGDHVDYLVDGHLHHPHGDHCDAHGPVALAG